MTRISAFIALALLLSACGGQWVESPVVDPEARIRSTEVHEQIVAMMEEYENSLEAMDLERIRSMVSVDYYENAGTTDSTDDDYGFQGFPAMIAALREHVDDMRIDIQVRDIIVEHDRADVLFEYGFTMLYRVGEDARWETQRDVNRLQLQREEGAWRIVGGL